MRTRTLVTMLLIAATPALGGSQQDDDYRPQTHADWFQVLDAITDSARAQREQLELQKRAAERAEIERKSYELEASALARMKADAENARVTQEKTEYAKEHPSAMFQAQ